jgi:hypothetical protein
MSYIQLNTSPEEIMALGSQFERDGEQFTNASGEAGKTATGFDENEMFGSDRLGRKMKEQYPEVEPIFENAKKLGENLRDIGTNIRTAAAMYRDTDDEYGKKHESIQA